MKRFLCATLIACVAAVAAPAAYSTEESNHLVLPKNGKIKVAFLLSEDAVTIDFAGPWEVFSNTMLPGEDKDMDERMPFQIYTVGLTKAPIHTSGNHFAGIAITPEFDFSDAPEPDLVVVPAQKGGPGMSAWLRKIHADHKVIMSVCTGAFRLAEAGLLNGEKATTHHGGIDALARKYPQVQVVRSVRYVQSDPLIFTSAGLSAGIDLALHVVEEYYGHDVAQQTADNMEYQGQGWKQ